MTSFLSDPQYTKHFKGAMYILLFASIFAIVNLFLWFLNQHDTQTTVQEPSIQTVDNTLPTYTASDVAARNTPEECWFSAYGNVYDVTSYIAANRHPGGRNALISGCGKEMTTTFDRIHSASAKNDLETLKIGILATE
jgi:cytochrome b involved in lipid metabolism